jgi:hypothetical protein
VVRRQLGKGDNKIRGIYSRAACCRTRAFNAALADRLDILRGGAPAVSLRRSSA